MNLVNSTMTGKDMLDALAASLATLISDGMQHLFGPGVVAQGIGSLSWADLATLLVFVLLALCINGLAAGILAAASRRAKTRPDGGGWRGQVFRAVGKPAYLLIWIYGAYLAATPLMPRLPSDSGPSLLRHLVGGLFDLGVFVAALWVFIRLTRALEVWLALLTKKTESKLDDLVVPLLGRSLRVIVPVLGIIFALPLIGLPSDYSGVVAKASSILLIGTVAWILFQTVNLLENAVLAQYDITAADNLQARKVYTQVHVLSKTLYVIIGIFTAASILMLFEEVRRFGTSLLASAGVFGIIVGFAAQRTIANLFAGFQLAMTQPIRLDDVVIVEGEWGRIEEITLTYVVVHIWDDRRLVVPLSYFIEKPFQNWTRVSAKIMGSVVVWADYSLPVSELRLATQKIVESCKDWDRQFWNVQVTEATDRAMQIRVLATAADSGKAWDLRCEIRERLIDFLQKEHAASLPRTRADISQASRDEPLPARQDGLP
jgi:small-conductance mechanosensitive channel